MFPASQREPLGCRRMSQIADVLTALWKCTSRRVAAAEKETSGSPLEESGNEEEEEVFCVPGTHNF